MQRQHLTPVGLNPNPHYLSVANELPGAGTVPVAVPWSRLLALPAVSPGLAPGTVPYGV